MGAHDEAWFEAVFAENARAVFRYFARRVPPDDVEDLTADVFATAWRRRDDMPDDAELPWLYRTAAFTLANFRRKTRPTPIGEVLESVDTDDSAIDPALGLIRDEEIRESLARLAPRDRQILFAVAWDGLSGDELAGLLGMSRGGADAALSRARARLRESWVA